MTRRIIVHEWPEGLIRITEGDKRTACKQERFDFTAISLTRAEIAKLAKMFPEEVTP